MKLLTLKCPNCGSSLEIENGIDIFFCKYCGHKIMLEDQSPEAINAKVSIKGMEHKERLVDKEHEQERYKLMMKEKQKKHDDKMVLLVMCMMFFVALICIIISSSFK